ncbi:hypothetical protein A3F02_02600 [Candidatus Curtissbacteria bacterium RIFCSPHIGHO2_12_FULL_38_9b]|uniref:Uncharacterized protein n=2 Tax=Candidatus Curtissiibacteriota TaxID=1752717 RepID=A0A1F5GY67_9BACT|nr:MAG: hypothetical protein A3A48_01085 [Candidatus Curtissbacteria bacterium RIFCSPLOWO2_01_FULL_37_9]OGD96759.1 MAG: hypothetical protein A3F02_02600 [Candidatus Curtissbacteria bacterium RIFCSPHIGHO2_12_FULL_38_9b]
MNKQTKLILTFVGAAAIIIPALLLIFLGSKTQEDPQVDSGSRTIDQSAIQNTVRNRVPKQVIVTTPTPISSPATDSAQPITEPDNLENTGEDISPSQ